MNLGNDFHTIHKLKILILSAGQGDRASSLTKGGLKSIYPLNSRGDTTLSLLLEFFINNTQCEITVVGGYQFNVLQKWLEEKNYLPKIQLIDARPQCTKGPFFSFMSASSLFNPSNMVLLIPADLYISPLLFDFLLKINYPFPFPQIFYQNLSQFRNTDRPGVMISETNGHQKIVEKFIQINKVNSSSFSEKKTRPIMLSLVILDWTIFKFVSELKNPPHSKLFAYFPAFLEKSYQILAHLVPSEQILIQDFDNSENFIQIQKMLEVERKKKI